MIIDPPPNTSPAPNASLVESVNLSLCFVPMDSPWFDDIPVSKSINIIVRSTIYLTLGQWPFVPTTTTAIYSRALA